MGDPDWTVRFPRVADYVGRLPTGLDSYPQCRCRASAYRVFIDPLDLGAFPFDDVPAPIRALVKHPLLHDVWAQETHVMATVLAAADFLGLDDEKARRWMDESNGRLVGGRMYRALMSLATPSLLLSLAPRQWGVFHRGTKLTAQRGRPTKVRIEYPAHIYNELIVHALGTAIRHAMAASRAKDPSAEVEEYTPTVTTFRVDWS